MSAPQLTPEDAAAFQRAAVNAGASFEDMRAAFEVIAGGIARQTARRRQLQDMPRYLTDITGRQRRAPGLPPLIHNGRKPR